MNWHTTFPEIEQKVYRIGYGTWQLGGSTFFGGKYSGYGHVDEQAAIAAIHYALDNDINFFDTADTYGKGRSETILGKALKQKKNAAIICTKYGNMEDENGGSLQDFSQQWLYKAVGNSLKRLKRDCIDILLLHSPPDDFKWQDFDPHPFDQLIRQGKIRKYGVSAKSVYGAKNVLENEFGSVIEVIYNVLDTRAEKEVFPLARRQGVNIIARVPLASGFLSNKYLDALPAFSKDDIRYHMPREQIDWLLASVKSLDFLATLPGGLTGSAIRFCLTNPDISVVIPGMKSTQQVASILSNVKQGNLPLPTITKIKATIPEVYTGWIKNNSPPLFPSLRVERGNPPAGGRG